MPPHLADQATSEVEGCSATLTSGTLQRKQGALGIDTSRDPATIRQFDRPLKDAASASIDALGGRADVVDIEVIEPTRLRHARELVSMPPIVCPTGRKQLIQVCRIGLTVGLLPAKKLAVKIKDLAPVFSQQLVPAYAPGLVQPAGLRLAVRQSGNQRKSGPLRIGDH